MNVIIREMKSEDKKSVNVVMRKSFPFLARIFFYFTKDMYVAEVNGEITGGVFLKTFNVKKDIKAGLVAWIFCSPDFKGLGLGQKLINRGIEFLEEEGCDYIFSTVEGDNTSSSKLFSNRGFVRLSPLEQFRLFGLRIFYIWFKTLHTFDIGYFLWTKGRDKLDRKNESFLLGKTVLISTLTAIIMFLRLRFGLNIGVIVSTLLIFILVYGLRILSMFVVARLQGLKTRYKMWESGLLLNLFISLAFGGLVPSPGSLYPRDESWTYRENKKELGIMALVSSILLISVLYILKIVLHYNIFPDLRNYINISRSITLALIIIDISIPFFPLSSFNGRRIWNWNRIIWLMLFIPIAAQFFIF